MKFSVVIIAYNEAKRIEQVLRSIQHADEVIVVDSGSQDSTAEICLNYGARVIQHPFEGYGQQKQFGVDQASNDWILSLDADEVPDPATWEHLRELCKTEPEVKAWVLKRQLVFLGKRFRYGKESRDKQLRFFDRRHARWSTPAVHEKIEFQGRAGRLRGYTAHYSYENLDDYFRKFNTYTNLASGDLRKRGKSRSNWVNALGVGVNFFKSYFIQLHFLNGYPGFCWALFSSVYTLVKYTKAKDI